MSCKMYIASACCVVCFSSSVLLQLHMLNCELTFCPLPFPLSPATNEVWTHCARVFCFVAGLDARAAAIVMRTVRNIVNTGRTIVCTIHQPSIDIFESFDELLLLKRGGETIFNGQLGQDSNHLIDYFQASQLLSQSHAAFSSSCSDRRQPFETLT